MADIDVLEIEEEDGVIEIEADGYDLDKITNTLEELGEHVEIVDSEKGWYPMDYIELSEEDQAAFDKMMDMLNEVEDVQEVFHNAKE